MVPCREAMSSRTEVFSDGAESFQKPLGLNWGFEPPHCPFPLSRRLVGVLRPVVESFMFAVFGLGEHLPDSRVLCENGIARLIFIDPDNSTSLHLDRRRHRYVCY